MDASDASKRLSLPIPSTRHTRKQSARPETFRYDHIFQLAGHGSSSYKDAYVLKDNEFYTTPTLCGYMSSLNTDMYFNFIQSSPTIYVPTPYSTSYFGNSNTSYLRKTTKQRHQIRLNLYHERDAYKMYVPFTTHKDSKTIQNTSFNPLSWWKLNIEDLDTPRDLVFSYNGLRKDYKKADVENIGIYEITTSGVLPCNKEKSNVLSYFPDSALKATSRLAVRTFCAPDYVPWANFFYVPISKYGLDAVYTPDTAYDDPILLYFRDVVTAVYSDSVLSPRELYGKDPTFYELLNGFIPISELYPRIRAAVGDEQPMIVINNICRNYRVNNTSHLVNSNINVNLRGYMAKFKYTLRGKKMKSRMRQMIQNYATQKYDRRVSLRRGANTPKIQDDIMKYVLRTSKITHDEYKINPLEISQKLAFLSGASFTRWHDFLKKLPADEFYTPNVDE